MFIRIIHRTRIFNLFRKSAYNARNITLLRRYPDCEILKGLPTLSKYFCFALLNLIRMAEAEPVNKTSLHADSANAIAQSDELFLLGKYQDSWTVLKPFKDSENVEVLWRISRALFNMSKSKEIKSSESASLIREAFTYIERALELNEEHFAVHKWMAILYDAKSSLDGIKARLQALPIFKQHLMRAIELNPKDATSIYMLGQYMYSLADMSWLQKTIAKTLFEKPPEASFEEAFHYFSKAEEVEPNFYSANLLMLGKTCLKLKKTEAGCYWLKCATAYPVRTDEDEAVRQEAEELLHKYPEFKKQQEGQKVKEEVPQESN